MRRKVIISLLLCLFFVPNAWGWGYGDTIRVMDWNVYIGTDVFAVLNGELTLPEAIQQIKENLGTLLTELTYFCSVRDKNSRAGRIRCRVKSVWMPRFDFGHIKNHEAGRLISQLIQQRPLYSSHFKLIYQMVVEFFNFTRQQSMITMLSKF